MSFEVYDLIIIGGGPVGIFAATYAKMRQAKVQVIESLDQLGGQVTALFSAKKIYDIPGYPMIKGTNLIQNLIKQTKQFEPEIHLNETVQKIDQEPDCFKLTTSQRQLMTKSIIIATGIGAFQPRKLKLPESSVFEGKQLQYFVNDPDQFNDKDLIIAGGGDSAVDWALEFAERAKSLHIVHRRENFRALESSVARLKETKTVFETPYLISGLKAADQQQIQVQLKEVRGKKQKTINADFLLVNYGIISSNKYLNAWGLNAQHGLIPVDSTMQTAVKGIYAIGDVATYPGKLNLIATGLGEAPLAINNAMNMLYPDRRQPAHSTQLVKNLPQFKNN
ncbi:NAD(P)/FAD-dependent oxidoreductase [Liquorilactobacillus sicerae]|uniref:NAD(P)/FAD-dependent oxidoreductase n=1 Tax=Liquorilactobacillus sicerae TaxID=1416943 RepID=UPI002480FA31|nr:NAD(P)/FAD-dependent oxidoreductase [Liquorilactobacillus sicerae]